MATRPHLIVVAYCMLSAAAFGQTTSIEVTATVGGTSAVVGANGVVSFTAPAVGMDALATITVRNTSASPIILSQLSLIGASDFSLALAASPFPQTVAAGATSAPFTLRYLPASGNRQTAQAALVYSEGAQTRQFSFTLAGSAPDFAITAVVQPDGTLQALTNGTTISFPVTNPGTTRVANVTIANFGSAPGGISAIVATGPDFLFTGASGPTTIVPGQELRGTLIFAPRARGTATGTLSLTVGGRSLFFPLQGSGGQASPTPTAQDIAFAYFIIPDGAANSLQNGGRIAFPATPLNSTRQATVVLTNRGTVAANLSSATVLGGGFYISSAPMLPYTLNPSQEIRLNVTFSASNRGTSLGSLAMTVNDTPILFTLEGLATVSNISIGYALASDGNARALGDNGRILFDRTPVNGNALAEIAVLNQGTGPSVINLIALTGAEFQLLGLPLLPATLEAGRALSFRVRYAPTRPGTSTGSLKIDLSDRAYVFPIEGSTSSPDLSISYLEPGTNNALPVIAGGTITLPSTAVAATQAVTVIIANRGQSPGTVNRINLQGTSIQTLAFRLAELPAFPATIDPGRDLRFSVRFTPTSAQRYVTGLEVDLGDRVVLASVDGAGVAPILNYELISSRGLEPLSPGDPILIPDTIVGQTTTVQVHVRNTGQVETQLTAAQISGTGFALPDPLILPARLAPDSGQRISVTFTPTQPGPATGRLRLGSDTFELRSSGLGSSLRYSFTNSAGTTNLPETGAAAVVFTPIALGDSSRVTFTVSNTGTAAATISTINLAASSAAFRLEGLPALPASLESGASLSFAITFAPRTLGTSDATLRVNSTSIALSGSAEPPKALPPFSFTGPSGVQQPLAQPAVGLRLESSYPLPIRGTLTLTFQSEVFGANPSAQFAIGGRTIAFTIPVGATEARFSNNATTVRVQTGTVAGNVVITPAFATDTAVDLTPSNAAPLTLTIERLAPRLLDVSVGSRTASGFSLVLTGYSTTRELRSAQLELVPVAGQTISNRTLSISLAAASLAWFESTTADSFGGLFTITIPVTFAGEPNADLVSRIRSVSVSLSNAIGASPPSSVDLLNPVNP